MFKIRLSFKRFIYITISLIVLGFATMLIIDSYIRHSTQSFIYNNIQNIPPKYTGLVLGAHVDTHGNPSDFLEDRLIAAYELYKAGKIKRFLLSGDHGHKYYDEVNNMKRYLLDKGVPECDIFLDHAGFDTYNSVVRAKRIFGVTDLIIVTQKFHQPRAIFIARKNKLDVCGYVADRQNYAGIKYLNTRERIACIKAWLEVTIHKRPKFLGDSIPITGNSRLSYD